MLEVQELAVSYQGTGQVLSGISLELQTGQIVAVLGPNGAGKTTLARTIGGSLAFFKGAVDQGSVRLDGKDITGWRPDQIIKQGLATVPEGRGLFPQLTVEENLRTGMRGRRRRERATLEGIYELFPRLAERAKLRAGFLSGGERQQLAVARGLASSPRLLIIDELSLGLAPIAMKTVLEELARINQESGVTILLVEQNAAVVLPLVDHAYVIETGQVVAAGTPDDLVSDAKLVELYLGGGGVETTSPAGGQE